MIKSESITVDAPSAGFVHLHHVQIEHNGVDMGGPMWFETDSLPWIIESLRACIEIYGEPARETECGGDSLKVFESGPEQAPIVNLRNRRAKDAEHGGVYALLMSKAIAEQLVERLAAL